MSGLGRDNRDTDGAWSKISVQPFEKEKLVKKEQDGGEEDHLNHDCWERTRVEIVKL